jgi:glycosyltransferase involved in cell wall biosynthesis
MPTAAPSPLLPPASVAGGRVRADRDGSSENRVRRDGKFFRIGPTDHSRKFHVKGFAYGPFAAGDDGTELPPQPEAEADLDQIAATGATVVRVYQTPPAWFLDACLTRDLRVLVDVAWPSNMSYAEGEGSKRVRAAARRAVRKAAKACGRHSAVFAISVANEIPADVVRYNGADETADLLDDLMETGRRFAPGCLFTFANYPSTEYLRPRTADFISFNVYLHEEVALRNYLARLQSLAGELPLVLSEYGVDTLQEASEADQATQLDMQLRAAFDEGLAGVIVFGFTDEWVVNGYRIEDWAFGVTKAERGEDGHRIEKPAYAAVTEVFGDAPHTARLDGVPAWDVLPKTSVIVCSYNGAGTVETCLKSLQHLNYPDYEVIFIDDGSTDNTQEIVRRFKRVRNIKQTNHGLSFARNVGMHAARGEVIVYTDSDCEADEDWLYHLVLAMKRSSHVGMGGPNLIPDEGDSDTGAVAEAVGLSPGGPTHVMIDDRTAEHVPGCNMAFLREMALEVGGFDSTYRKAGDDVDFIWRLQDKGYTIGFSPAAQVWHYRRNTIEAYLNQQRGYGEAEAMLQFKHVDRFNTIGASLWHGRIYGPDGPGSVGLRVGHDIIYHGVQGTGLFQTIYRQRVSLIAAMMMSLEWHLVAGFVAILGIVWLPLLAVAAAMELTSIGLAVASAYQQPKPKRRRWWSRPLIAYLHWRQPIARGWARYQYRLRSKTRGESNFRRNGALPRDPLVSNVLRYWWGNGWGSIDGFGERDRFGLLQRIQHEAQAAKIHVRPDSGWHDWDLELFGSRVAKSRVASVDEKHADGRLVKVRVSTEPTGFCKAFFLAVAAIAIVASFRLWPLGLYALTAPALIALWYRVSAKRLRRRVMNLVDLSAERVKLMGVWPQAKTKVTQAVDVEEQVAGADSPATPQPKPAAALA